MIVPIRLSISNAFLVRGERPVLIDTGCPGDTDTLLRALAKEGIAARDLSLMPHTHGHRDHAGGTRRLKGMTAAPVAVHPTDAGVDQHDPIARTHEEAAERQLELVVAREELAMRCPGVDGHVQERIADREQRHAVQDRLDVEIPHSHGADPTSVVAGEKRVEAQRDRRRAVTGEIGLSGGLRQRQIDLA